MNTGQSLLVSRGWCPECLILVKTAATRLWHLSRTSRNWTATGLSTPICAWPVNPPAPARHRHPEQPLWRGIPRMMVKRGGSLIEPAGVPGIVKPELLKIEMVAKFVAKRTQERAEGGDLFSHCRPHPDADQHSCGRVVPEKFGGPVFANSQRPGCKHADFASRDLVKLRCGTQKLFTGTAELPACPRFNGRANGFRNREQTFVLGVIESRNPVALEKSCAACPPRWGVCEHLLIF